MHVTSALSSELLELVRMERLGFAAKIRTARAVLGWSQSELGAHVGLTQRAIHKLEQGDTEPRRTTMHVLEEIWRLEGVEFEDLGGGAFRCTVRSPVLDRAAPAKRKKRQHS